MTVPGHTGKVPGLTEIGCSTPFHSNGALHIIAPGSAKFLFIPDITYKATGIALIVLIVLYVGSQLVSTLVATATADPNQRRLMLLLPVVFVVILYRYPAGLLVYWITTNLWTIGQQYLIKRHMGPLAAPADPAKGVLRGREAADLRTASPTRPRAPERQGRPALAGSAPRAARPLRPAAAQEEETLG